MFVYTRREGVNTPIIRWGTDRPAATPGSSLQAVTTKYWGLTSKRRRHGAIYPGTVWRVVTWQRRGTNWVYWLRSRDHRGARPQQLPPPLRERAGGGAAPPAASIHTSSSMQQRNRVRSLAGRSSVSGRHLLQTCRPPFNIIRGSTLPKRRLQVNKFKSI